MTISNIHNQLVSSRTFFGVCNSVGNNKMPVNISNFSWIPGGIIYIYFTNEITISDYSTNYIVINGKDCAPMNFSHLRGRREDNRSEYFHASSRSVIKFMMYGQNILYKIPAYGDWGGRFIVDSYRIDDYLEDVSSSDGYDGGEIDEISAGGYYSLEYKKTFTSTTTPRILLGLAGFNSATRATTIYNFYIYPDSYPLLHHFRLGVYNPSTKNASTSSGNLLTFYTLSLIDKV